MNSDLSFFKNNEFFELLEEFATKKELKQLRKSKNFKKDILELVSTFIKRKNWIKWRNYFEKYATLKDQEKLKKMIDGNQIYRAYFFMQQKFASSLESLASYADGAIVAKILSYLQVSDLRKIAKISNFLTLIIIKYHLIERRNNIGILIGIKNGVGVTKFCYHANTMFVSVHDGHELRVYEYLYSWTLRFTKKFENVITHITCSREQVVVVDADNNVYFFNSFGYRKYFEFENFSISKNENIQNISENINQIIYISTNLNIYKVKYIDEIPKIEKINIILNSRICSNIVCYENTLIYFAGNNLYFEKNTQNPIVGLKGSILDYWLQPEYEIFRTIFYVKTDVSIFYLNGNFFKNVKDDLPSNYNFNILNIKKIVFNGLNICILSNNGILEIFNRFKKTITVIQKNVIDTNFYFIEDDAKPVYVTWKDDDPKWPVIASPCVSCGIQSADMFGCGNKCSAVYCSKQCAADDWSTNHSNECK